jgi:sigma-B regulation protein RsbU (phosphoserine phosphatase)
MSQIGTLLIKLLVLSGVAAFVRISFGWLKPSDRRFLPIFLIAAVRDIVFYFLPLGLVSFAADALIPFCYLYWLRGFTGGRRMDLAAALVSAAGVLGVAAATFTDAPLSQVLSAVFFNSAWILPSLVIIAIRLFAVSAFNTRDAQIIIDLRRSIVLILAALWLVSLGLGYASLYLQGIVYPLSYILHAVILFMVARSGVEARDGAIKALGDDTASHFTFMQRLSNAVGEKIEIAKILSIVVESAVRDTGGDGGAILLLDSTKNTLCFRAVGGSYSPPFVVPSQVMIKVSHLDDYLYSRDVEIGSTILGESFKSAAPVFIQNVAQDGRLPRETQNATTLPSSIIVAPLVMSRRILGVISVTKKSWGQYFSTADFTRLQAFADYASLSIDMHLTYLEVLEKREIEHEMGIAAEIQQKLISFEAPNLKQAELALLSVPAHGVNGDYFHLLSLGDGKLGFVVGDVAGKGIAAALVMVMIHSMLHLIASPRRDLAQMLMWINRGLIGQVEIDHYATLSIVCFDTATCTIQYSNAAHYPLMVIRAGTGQTEIVDTKGLPIGIDDASAYEVKSIPFQSGDVALVYTDGIVEALNPAGEQYTLERLSTLVRTHSGKPAEAIKDAVRKDLADFVQSAKQHDDQTLIILKAV